MTEFDENIIISILTHCLAFGLGAAAVIIFTCYTKSNSRINDSHGCSSNKGFSATATNHHTNSNVETISSQVVKKDETKHRVQNSPESVQEEKKPSKRELRDQQRKEEKARIRAAAQECRLAEALEKKKKAFNPLVSKPENAIFYNLAVSDGKLVPCSVGQTYYYHYWEYEGTLYYEFFCEQSKVAKAVNNRSVIIDPFCQKDSESVAVDNAKSMLIKQYGVIDSDFKVISKSVISYR